MNIDRRPSIGADLVRSAGRLVVSLLGPPASGKGTQASLVSSRYGIPVVSIGQLIRQHLRDKTGFGRMLDETPQDGVLPDEIALGVVLRRLASDDCSSGFILDGFPRTEAQARSLVTTLLRPGDRFVAVLIEQSDDETARRASRRRSCERCAGIVASMDRVCGTCGSPVVVRGDDADAAYVATRIASFRSSEAVIAGILSSAGVVHRVLTEGLDSPADLNAKIQRAIEGNSSSGSVMGPAQSNGAGIESAFPRAVPVLGAAPTQLQTIISGSFRRHLDRIYRLRARLVDAGITVLSPVGTRATNPGDEFVVLDADCIGDPRLLQDSIFAKLRMSSFMVLANFDGHIGAAAALEIGYAASLGLQVLAVEPVTDPNLAAYCRALSDVLPSVLPQSIANP